jgi:hypothetical protein
MPVAAGDTVRSAFCGLLALFSIFPLFAQSGEWGSRGITRRFAVRDRFVFAADGRGVAVYDAATVRRLAAAETDSESVDVAPLPDGTVIVATKNTLERYAVAVDGRLALQSSTPIAGVTRLAAGENGLLAGVTPFGIILWKPDRDSIAQQAGFAVHGAVNALLLRGNALFGAVEGEGVQVIDVSGAHETATIAENAKDLALAGNTLFVAAGVSGLTAVDVSDPWSARVISRGGGEIYAQRVAAVGGRVAVAELPDVIHLFDAADPAAPRAGATIREPVQALAAGGTQIFVAGSFIDPFGLTTETGVPIRAYDVGDAASPRLAGEVRDLAGPVTGAATDGTLAYVVDHPLLRIIDVSATAAPREIASLPIDGIGDRIKLRGKQAILYGRGDVQLVDVADPYHPRMVNVFRSNGRPPSNAAFTRNGIIEGNPWTGFHVVDFNFPTPAIIASIKSHYYEVISNGDDAAYLGAEARSVAAVDVGTRGVAAERGLVTVGVVQADIAAATTNHEELLLVRARDGLHVYSLADPFQPSEIGSMPLGTDGAFAAAGDVAYVADGNGVVSTVDLTSPRSPSLAPTAMKSVAPAQIAVHGGKIVVADRYSLRVYGPNTPPPPQPAPARRRAAAH